MNPTSFVASAVTAVALVSGASVVSANAANLKSSLSLSFYGLNVGKLKNQINVSNSVYSISGAVSTNALVSLVSRISVDYVSKGGINGRTTVPTYHYLKYKQKKKRGNLTLGFAGGDIKKNVSSPAIKYKPDAVPLGKSHLKAALDPVSSLIFPVKAGEIGNGRKICDRTLPVFDGRAKFNLTFRYKSSRTQRARGFSGKTFTCSVRYKPVAGYRPNKKEILFMKKNRDMEITVAQVGKSNVYALFAFKVKTLKGIARGKATKFASN